MVSELKAAVSNSRVFGGVAVSQKDGYADLTFQLSGNRTLWGYDITYGREGGINVFAKYKPSLQQGSRPLAGITIAVDAGHGGSDPGAVGVPGTKAAMEKDINLATAIAVQKRLESLGATVLMTRAEDENPPINDRMQGTVDADLFISLHCNSISYDRDTNKAGGTEVYYYLTGSVPAACPNPRGQCCGLHRPHQPGREVFGLPGDPQYLCASGTG